MCWRTGASTADSAADPSTGSHADLAAMLSLPPVAPMVGWRTSLLLPRDHYVHHAEVIALKGDRYRLRNRDLGRTPSTTNQD